MRVEVHYPWKEPGDTCDSEDEGQHPSSAVLPNQKLRSVLDSALSPNPRCGLWKSFTSPSRTSSMFHISMVPPESAALVFFAWTSTTCSQVASLSPWAGLGSVIQNIIKRRSLACLNPELTFHPFGMRLACKVWSCQAYTSRRWPSWAH